MKFRSMFELVGDAKDVVDFFGDVESIEQMISKLERIKRREPEEFLVCIQSLKLSIDTALDDTFEMGGGGDLDEEDDNLDDEEISELEHEGDDKPPEPGQEPGTKT